MTFLEENSTTTIKALRKQAARENRKPNQTINQEILSFFSYVNQFFVLKIFILIKRGLMTHT